MVCGGFNVRKQILIFMVLMIVLTTTVSAVANISIPYGYQNIRYLDDDTFIMVNEDDLIEYRDSNGELINSINTSPIPASRFIDWGVSPYNSQTSLKVTGNYNYVEFENDTLRTLFLYGIHRNGSFTTENISEVRYVDNGTAYHTYWRAGDYFYTGETEDWYFINAYLATGCEYVIKNKNNDTGYSSLTHSENIIFGCPAWEYGGNSGSDPSRWTTATFYNDDKIAFYFPLRYNNIQFALFSNSNPSSKILTYGTSSNIGSYALNDDEMYYSTIKNGKLYLHSNDYPENVTFAYSNNPIENTPFNTQVDYEYIDNDNEKSIDVFGGFIHNDYKLFSEYNNLTVFTVNDIFIEGYDFVKTLFNDYGLNNPYIPNRMFLLGNKLIYSKDGNVTILTGLPSQNANPEITPFQQKYSVELNSQYGKDGVSESNLLYEDTYDVVYPYEYEYSVTKGYGITDINKPVYQSIVSQYGERTGQNTTPIIIQTFDKTNDLVNLAYDCNYKEQKDEYEQIENYEDDSDVLRERYNTTCPNYVYTTDATLHGIEDYSYLTFFENCSDTITNDDANGLSSSTQEFRQSAMIGYGMGYKLSLKNIYGSDLATVTLRHVKNGSSNYAYVAFNDNVVYNTTTISELVNYNRDIIIVMDENEINLKVDGVVTKTYSNSYSLPIKEIDYTLYEQTENPTGEPDITLIGGWSISGEKTLPEQNEGVEYLSMDGTYRYYKINCSFTEEEQTLRIWYDDDELNYNRYEDYYIEYDDLLYDKLSYTKTEQEQEEQEERQVYANSQLCSALSICNAGGRMIFAVLITIGLTFLSVFWTSKNYYETSASALVPIGVYALCFTTFSFLGFFEAWFIVLNIVVIAGASASKLNPINHFGRGGRRYE